MSGVDVLAELDALIVIRASRAATDGASLTAIGDLQRAEATRAAVADLIEASTRTIRAFEAYGKSKNLVVGKKLRSECEAAMVAQKAALANVGAAS